MEENGSPVSRLLEVDILMDRRNEIGSGSFADKPVRSEKAWLLSRMVFESGEKIMEGIGKRSNRYDWFLMGSLESAEPISLDSPGIID